MKLRRTGIRPERKGEIKNPVHQAYQQAICPFLGSSSEKAGNYGEDEDRGDVGEIVSESTPKYEKSECISQL